MEYRVADLCAGIGGIRLGFAQAAVLRPEVTINCVFTSESDAHCRSVYAHNFPDTHSYNTDINTIDVPNMPDFDILLAGFPCQAFSSLGKKKGFDDTRGTIFFKLVEIIKTKRPRVFFLENVRGLTFHDAGRTFQIIKRYLRYELGDRYTLYYEIINALDFGLAQNRDRIYFVGFRDPHKFRFPAPIGRRPLRDFLDPIPAAKLYLPEAVWDRMVANKKTKSGYGYILRSVDQHAGTLTKGGSGENNLIIDPRVDAGNSHHVRRLSLDECKRLQGFPDHFRLTATPAVGYQQLGNSVAVPVIEHIATQIYNFLAEPPIPDGWVGIIEIMKILYYNRVFDLSGRKSIKSLTDICTREFLEIPDWHHLQNLGLVKKVNSLYIDFDPRLSGIDNTLDLIQYCESKCAGQAHLTQMEPSGSPPESKSVIFILKSDNRWGFVHADQGHHGHSHTPIVDGLLEFLSHLSWSWKGIIYIDSRCLYYRLQSIDRWVADHWRQFDLAEFEQMRHLDAELRRLNLLGAQIRFAHVRKQRHHHMPEYIATLQLLQP